MSKNNNDKPSLGEVAIKEVVKGTAGLGVGLIVVSTAVFFSPIVALGGLATVAGIAVFGGKKHNSR